MSACGAGNLQGIAFTHNDTGDLRGDAHHFVDAHPAAVSVFAHIAAHGFHNHGLGQQFFRKALAQQHLAGNIVGRRAAFAAQAPAQALRDDQADGGGQIERRHAHIEQACDGLRGAVGVQRGQHEVAGLRRFDGDFRGLQIADLPDHDDVRILAQEGAQRLGEIQTDLRVHLHLIDAA